jgi:hypothetical protein
MQNFNRENLKERDRLESLRYTWDDNIKMNLKDIQRKGV